MNKNDKIRQKCKEMIGFKNSKRERNDAIKNKIEIMKQIDKQRGIHEQEKSC